MIPKIERALGPPLTDLSGRHHADGEAFTGTLPDYGPIPSPSACPACGGDVVLEGAFLKCPNLLCDARTSRSVFSIGAVLWNWTAWVKNSSNSSLNLDSVTAADLYRFTMEGLIGLERMGEKSATNVLAEVEKARTMSLGKFLHALGLPGIGPELASSMAAVMGDAPGLLSWLDRAHAEPGEDAFGPTLDGMGPYGHNTALRTVLEVDGVGEIVALQFRDGPTARRTLVEDLIGLLNIEKEVVKTADGPFAGMTFCRWHAFRSSQRNSRTHRQCGREDRRQRVNKLSVLVAGEKAGSKLTKATNLGVEIWSEGDLNARIGDNRSRKPEPRDRQERRRSILTG